MATFRGIAAVGTGVLALLDDAWARDPFVPAALDSRVVRAEDLRTRPFSFGVTLFAYRIAVNGTQRTVPPSRPDRRRPLPVEVNFLLSAWGPSAERELELLGWCMRVLDDAPVLVPSELNRAVSDVFGPDEIVEVVPDALSIEEMSRLWDALPWDHQLSAAYSARVVRLESTRELTEAGPVLEREFAMAVPGGDA